MPAKRARADGGYGKPFNKGLWMSLQSAKRFPYKDYMRVMRKRGTPEGMAHYGETLKKATPAQKAARTSDGIIGRGLYQSNRGGYFSDIGGHLGDLFGKGHGDMGKAGRGIGHVADSLMARFGGRGGYGPINSNSLISSGSSAGGVPSFQSAGDETGELTITHREYVADVFGNISTVPFRNEAWSLNPGIEKTFPWLSQIAANYEEYDMKQLMFTFRSTTSDIGSSTNGQVGTVIMATNYNAAQPAFSDKKTMMEYHGASSCKTTEPMMHGVECDPSKLSGSEGRYVRTNPVLAFEDLKTYDYGTFQLALSGTPAGFANQSIGELWVSYTVSLRKPKFYTTLGLGISRDVFVSNGTETGVLPFGTQASLLSGQQNNIGCALLLTNNTQQIVFPASFAGVVCVTYIQEGSAGGVSAALATGYGGNVAIVNDMYGAVNGGGNDAPAALVNAGFAASSVQGVQVLHVRVAVATFGVDNVINFVTTAGAGAPTQSMIDICEYNSYNRPVNNPAPVLVNSAGTVVVV